MDRNIAGAEALQKGGIILVETGTVLGLATRPENVEELVRVKGARKTPFTWVFSDYASLRECWVCRTEPNGGIEGLWNERMTLVVPGRFRKRERNPLWAGAFGLGLRLGGSDSLIPLAIAAGTPYLLTSANKKGEEPPVQYKDAPKEIRESVDGAWLGARGNGKPTSVVAWTEGGVVLLRGAMPKVFL
ncbi:Sua5/YciO/YrdC/YwlC family protein [bacterium]|nr:Sua5/YciO/YrdC/YwlC family protein [bacterium]